AALAPIHAVMISVGILIFADLATGMWAAKKRGENITSAAMRRTVSKLFIYQLAVITGFLLETHLLAQLLPVTKLVAGVIGLVEFKSILENANEILGQNIFTNLLSKLGSDNDDKFKQE
ncbi:MAG TPA: phage holin family protein, partial [Bacteroidia bacterium]